MIRFNYEGKNYRVDDRAYYCDTIVLPNGTAIQPHAWLQSMPPQIASSSELPHLFKDLPPDEIAKQLGNAIVAEEA